MNSFQKVLKSGILSLACLNASIVISWIAYHNYQPALLKQLGIEHLSQFLAIVQCIVLVCIPPIAGWLADKMLKKNPQSFLVYSIGISVTAMIFMSVASLLNFTHIQLVVTLLPLFIIVWLISMNIFNSPANSLLELFAPKSDLPVAMAIIAMITELLNALEPVIIEVVNFIGASYTFVLGGVLIILSGYYFKKTSENLVAGRNQESIVDNQRNDYILIVLCGLSQGLLVGLTMNPLKDMLAKQSMLELFSRINGQVGLSLFLVIVALFTYPASKLVEKFGLRNSVVRGLIVYSLGFIALLYLQILLLPAILFMAAGMALCIVSAFPLVLENTSIGKLTLCTGIFMGLTELTDNLFSVFGFEILPIWLS